MGNVIEINGKKYDAVTGKILKTEAEVQRAKTRHASGVSVDGMMGKRHKKPQNRASVTATKTIQRSHTLMRTAVKKPAQPILKTKSKPTNVSGITKSHLGTNEQRLQKASETKKNPLISHFGETASSPIIKKVQHLEVKKPVLHSQNPAPKRHHQPQLTHNQQHAHAKTVSAPAAASSQLQPRKRSVAAAKMIEAALANATAHEQPLHTTPKRRHKLAHKLGISARAITISSTVLAGILLGGFFAVQNVPNLSMRVAAARAGFDATMPGYNPSGFSFKGPIEYSPGQVTISFKSHTDERTYNVTQRASNWNSDALQANFVAVNGQQYQAYKDHGRTLFIYGESNATWVDNGIWYQVEGDSKLSTDQLIRLAASM